MAHGASKEGLSILKRHTSYLVTIIWLIIINVIAHLWLLDVNKQIELLYGELIAVQEEQKLLQLELDRVKASQIKVIQGDLRVIQDDLEQIQRWLSKGQRLIVGGTAYTPNDPGMDGCGITSTGVKATKWRTIAADPEVIQLGSVVYIPYFRNTPSRGWFVAEDTGGAIKGNKIDIFIPNRAEALEFGRQDLEIYVYRPEDFN